MSPSTINRVSFTKLVDKHLCPQQTGSVSQNLWRNISVHNKWGQFHKTCRQTSLSTINGVSFTKLVDKRLCPQQTGSVSLNLWTNVSVHNKRGQFHYTCLACSGGSTISQTGGANSYYFLFYLRFANLLFCQFFSLMKLKKWTKRGACVLSALRWRVSGGSRISHGRRQLQTGVH